ncbi:hypothetical protein [Gymnodinialimonas hymeniacidonis]|uniref:hypothetical protein n=1 Tax=Gymnodinialimonas hymeniacidonis TaxID=3126508 RepID=UPI0034C61497
MFAEFATDESGAVTVDWVLLTGGLVGLGLATMAVLSSGIENLTGDIANSLANVQVGASPFSNLSSIFSDTFSSGSAGWSGGQMVNLAGFGNVLQLGPGVLATTSAAIPSGATNATITFDLIGVDDLSGAPATVFVNGQAVAIYADNHGNITTSAPAVPGISVTVDQQYTNDPMGSGSHGHDSRATYTITVEDPGETITFGVGSNSTEPTSDEFYAIDDVDISAG